MKSKIAYIILEEERKMVVATDYLPERTFEEGINRADLEEDEFNAVTMSNGVDTVKFHPNALYIVAYQRAEAVEAPEAEEAEHKEEVAEEVSEEPENKATSNEG